MSIVLTGSIDYAQIDALMERLNVALRNRSIGAVTGRRAYKQVKEKYGKRWKDQTKYNSIYQRTKRESAAFGTGFPSNNAEPGFLTGGTFRGIHLRNTALGSVVSAGAEWPGKNQTDFEAGIPSGGKETEGGGLEKNGWATWFCGGSGGIEFYINGGWQKRATRDESGKGFDSPTYLNSTSPLSEPAEKVNWLLLDSEDQGLIRKDLEIYLTGMIHKNPTVIKAMFKAQEYKKEKAQSVERIEAQLEAESLAGVNVESSIDAEDVSGIVLAEIEKIQQRIAGKTISEAAGRAQIEQLKAWKG